MLIQRFGKNPGGPEGGLIRSSQIVVHNKVAYLVCTPDKPYDPHATVGEQTRQVLARIDRRLQRSGSNKSKLLSVMVMLSDIRFFNEMNSVWDKWIDPENPPIRACCAVQLGKPDLKVEMIVTAACD